jgi:hypothetical protein
MVFRQMHHSDKLLFLHYASLSVKVEYFVSMLMVWLKGRGFDL